MLLVRKLLCLHMNCRQVSELVRRWYWVYLLFQPIRMKNRISPSIFIISIASTLILKEQWAFQNDKLLIKWIENVSEGRQIINIFCIHQFQNFEWSFIYYSLFVLSFFYSLSLIYSFSPSINSIFRSLSLSFSLYISFTLSLSPISHSYNIWIKKMKWNWAQPSSFFISLSSA